MLLLLLLLFTLLLLCSSFINVGNCCCTWKNFGITATRWRNWKDAFHCLHRGTPSFIFLYIYVLAYFFLFFEGFRYYPHSGSFSPGWWQSGLHHWYFLFLTIAILLFVIIIIIIIIIIYCDLFIFWFISLSVGSDSGKITVLQFKEELRTFVKVHKLILRYHRIVALSFSLAISYILKAEL